jgi:hypothetical protein
MDQINVQGQAARNVAKQNRFALHAAVFGILMASGSLAQARTDSVRWTHGASDLAGFRIYASPTSTVSDGSMIEDLAVAEAGPNADGVYFFGIDVPDDDTVYITVTAYNDDDLESFRSNQLPYGPPPVSDRDGDGVPDSEDAFPDDPSESADSDSDGVGDNGDLFPDDGSEWADSDGDGYGDNGDLFPNDGDEWSDRDGDGYGDNADAFPDDPTQYEVTTVLSPYRVNAGATQDLELSDGRTWTQDMGFWNTGTANAIDSSVEISSTGIDQMYRSSHTDSDDGNEMEWRFPLTNGSYTLKLHFAEHVHTQVGQRQFDVEVEGVRVLTDFDIFAEAGNARNRAVVKSFTVQLTDEVLDLTFLHRPDRSDPTVMGIEIVSDDALQGPLLTTPGKPFLIDAN